MKPRRLPDFELISSAADLRGNRFQEWRHKQYPRLTVRVHSFREMPLVRTYHVEDYCDWLPIESLEDALEICRLDLRLHYANPKRRIGERR